MGDYPLSLRNIQEPTQPEACQSQESAQFWFGGWVSEQRVDHAVSKADRSSRPLALILISQMYNPGRCKEAAMSPPCIGVQG